MALRTKKMNAPPSEEDGLRICIMRDARIYNRQLKLFKEKYGLPMYDEQMKELAPSKELKNGYRDGSVSWDEYITRFTEEVLIGQADTIKTLAKYALVENVTLLCTEPSPTYCHRSLVATECKNYELTLELLVE